jgi:riboflavin kinase / FMN adenylyltransferase
MRIIDATEQAALQGSVVAVGSFDGVHRGHRQLLNALRRIGVEAGLKTALVTFDPLPRAVISPETAPPLICSVQMRLQLLEQTGAVDYCCVLPFNEQTRQETVEEFVEGSLIRRLGMRNLVVGENFACGRERKGDVAYLTELGRRYGFSVEVQPLHTPSGLPRCSSTEARRLIELGELAEAARLLDRAHEITGVVLGNAGSKRRSILHVALDESFCTPPEDDYLGAARMSDGAGRWRKATLKVCAAMSWRRRIVHLTFAGEHHARAGDTLTMRFKQRALLDT